MFQDPQITDGEKSLYAITIAGRSDAYQATNVIDHDGEDYVSSIDAGIDHGLNLTVQQRFRRADGTMSAESYQAETRFEGKLVTREEGYFRDTQHLQFGGELQPFPNGVMPLLGGLTLLRGLDFSKGHKAKLDLWLAFSVHWPIEVKVEKQTSVKVAAGTFQGWQVRIRPSFAHVNGLLDKVVSGFLPPFVAHFDAADGHRMLRFSFPTGPMPWNPRGLFELSS